ncbi:hypothetical protein A9168_00100 [Macellibacteroides sp. HH-ZS]|nr:hypothetical protein A9168_00100 [Macellibacteroides sp. HH-ZS]
MHFIKVTNMIHNELPLSQMLLRNTKDDLIRMAEILGIRIVKSKKKSELAKVIADVILLQPLVLLTKLSFKEVSKLNEIVLSEKHYATYNPDSLSDSLYEIGLTDIYHTKDRFFEVIYSDLNEALTPIIGDFAESSHYKDKYRREQLVLGLINIYGVLWLEEIEKLFYKYESQKSSVSFVETVSGSYLLSILEVKDAKGQNTIYVASSVEDLEATILGIKERKLILKSEFTLEEVMAAGDFNFPIPPLKKTDKIFTLLKEMSKSQYETDQWISEFWCILNQEKDLNHILSELSIFFPDSVRMDKAISIVVDFANSLPKWILRGSSSEEIFMKYEQPILNPQPPQIVMGPNMQKAEISISQQQVNVLWDKRMTSASNKIGRNDPCPCGRGKKYKHCCGKN